MSNRLSVGLLELWVCAVKDTASFIFPPLFQRGDESSIQKCLIVDSRTP